MVNFLHYNICLLPSSGREEDNKLHHSCRSRVEKGHENRRPYPPPRALLAPPFDRKGGHHLPRGRGPLLYRIPVLQKKPLFHRASMQYYRDYLRERGYQVRYLENRNGSTLDELFSTAQAFLQELRGSPG
ncbi:MAG: cryptochrome/photolyase family protein [Methanomicrobiaceae archaeon]|nr:cryptochrome/photolyase family protein [Methanomicrobiaceae archaeon]